MTHAESKLLLSATHLRLAAVWCDLAFADEPDMVRTIAVFRVSPEAEPPPHDSPPSHVASSDAVAIADGDAALARRGQDGDRAAMETLVLRHHAAVTRLLWRFARNRSDLEDLVQDTFARMVRALPDWQPQQPFERWLLRIATNTGRDYFRRQAVRRRWMVEPTTMDEGEFAEPAEPSANPAARAAANEVKAMLASLPPEDRALLTLHHLEGWSLAQIAEQFGWTITATKLRAWRAHRRLRTLLQSREFDEHL